MECTVRIKVDLGENWEVWQLVIVTNRMGNIRDPQKEDEVREVAWFRSARHYQIRTGERGGGGVCPKLLIFLWTFMFPHYHKLMWQFKCNCKDILTNRLLWIWDDIRKNVIIACISGSVPGLVVKADDDGRLGEPRLVGGVRGAAPVAAKVGQRSEREIFADEKFVSIWNVNHLHAKFHLMWKQEGNVLQNLWRKWFKGTFMNVSIAPMRLLILLSQKFCESPRIP